MADQKISQLTALTGATTASDDLLVIVDTSAGQTKNISLTQLQQSPFSSGSANGVLYLDASKVPVTNSAFQFSGTAAGVGAASTGSKLYVYGAQAEIIRAEGTTADTYLIINQSDASATNSNRPVFSLRKANTPLFKISCDGAAANTGITYYEAQTSTGAHAFYTNSAERFRIDNSGNALVNGVGGLGYGTGSGGAVTQITSRTTGVTLDKTNGAITLVSAAGSTSWQTFTVTNNKVAATDTIIVNQKSGTDLNEIHVTAVAAGSFNISFRTTGGTTTEQPVFNFSVIKAVTA